MICLLYSVSLLKNPVHLSTQLLFYLLPQCNLVLGDQSDATGTCIKVSALLRRVCVIWEWKLLLTVKLGRKKKEQHVHWFPPAVLISIIGTKRLHITESTYIFHLQDLQLYAHAIVIGGTFVFFVVILTTAWTLVSKNRKSGQTVNCLQGSMTQSLAVLTSSQTPIKKVLSRNFKGRSNHKDLAITE